MFIELMPMLAGRTIMITVARENDTTLRVNVLPTRSSDNENPATRHTADLHGDSGRTRR